MTSKPSAFHPAQVSVCSEIPASAFASAILAALIGSAFALIHARCRASEKLTANLRKILQAWLMILLRLYFVVFLL